MGALPTDWGVNVRVVLGRSLFIAAVVALVVPPLALPSSVGAAPAAPLTVGVERAVSTARPGNAQGNADVAWNGSLFFVVWEESPAAGGPTQIYGARVQADGTVLDPGGILLASDEFNSMIRPKVAGGAGRFMIVWQIEIEGTYSDLGAAIVTSTGAIQRQWGLSFVDNGQTSPDVAWNGQMFLAVWQDEPDPDDEDIYGARVLPSGLTLDGCSTDACPNGDDPGIAIAYGPGNQLAPVVSAANGLFVVAWTDVSDPSHTTVRDGAVAINGYSLDTSGIPITSGPGAQTQPAVTTNGMNALFAWTDTRPGFATDIHATTMQPGDSENWNPTPGQPNGITASAARGDQNNADVARRSGHFVAVWQDMRSGGADVYASRIGAAGAVLDPTGVAIAAGPRQQRLPAVATTGQALLVAYERDAPAAPFNGVDRIFVRIVT